MKKRKEKLMSIDELPYDLERLLEEREIKIMETDTVFDKLMLKKGFFIQGLDIRNRIISDTADFFTVVKGLTGKNEDEYLEHCLTKEKEENIKKMKETAEKEGYIIIDKDISEYIEYSIRRKNDKF